MNIVAKTRVSPLAKLSSLFLQFPPALSDALRRVYLPYRGSNLSIFPTGSVICRSSRSISELEATFKWFRTFLNTFQLKLADDYSILNIVAVADISPPLNLLLLASYLPHCSYDPSPLLFHSHEHLVDSIVFRFNHDSKPMRTALIFSTGNVTLTGFDSVPDLQSHAIQLSSLIVDIMQKHPEILKGDRE